MYQLCFDLTKYENEVASYYQSISKTSGKDARTILRELLLFILKNYEEGMIGPKKLAYDIAGTMQYSETNTGKLKEIAELAGELELPNNYISGDPQQKLKQLIAMVKSL